MVNSVKQLGKYTDSIQNLGTATVASPSKTRVDVIESGTVHIKEFLKTNGVSDGASRGSPRVRNQLFSRTNIRGYGGLKSKYATK